jgi:hypothetical protein
LDSRLQAIKALMTLIRPIKFDDDKSKAPASFLFSLGPWLISSLFISIQLLPPASLARLSEVADSVVGIMVEMMVTDTMFLRLHFAILSMLLPAQASLTDTSLPILIRFWRRIGTRDGISCGIDADNFIQGER